jgi:DNA damage-binding protein 1
VAIAKSNRIEIRQFRSSTEDATLPLLLTLPIHGRPTSLLPLSFPSIKTDLLFFTTERGEYALISYDPTKNDTSVGKHYPVKTHASGSFASYSTFGSTAECGPLVALDDKNRCIALHLYDGWMTILPIHAGYDDSKRGVFGEAFHVRIEERTVLGMTFLMASKERGKYHLPQLTLLYQDSRGFQHVVSHGVSL